MGRANFGGSPELIRQNILSGISAGMFFVPAKEKPFSGSLHFFLCLFVRAWIDLVTELRYISDFCTCSYDMNPNSLH
jgi:hypothetical protein